MTSTSPPTAIPNQGIAGWIIVLLLRLYKIVKPFQTVEGLRKLAARFEKRKPKLPASISLTQESICNMTCDRLLNSDSNGKIILHLYGGAGCVRLPNMEIPAIARLCQRIGAEAYLPWYGLAPEQPFPKGIHDSVAIYQELLTRGIQPENIILSGSSAGGGTALSLLHMLKKENLPMPGCAVLISPSGDCLMRGKSWVENGRKDPIFYVSEVLYFQQLMFADNEVADPLVNVTLANDFAGYPPLYLTASSTELMRDVTTIAADNAMRANVTCQLDIYQGGYHCMPLMTSNRQSNAIWTNINNFINSHIP